MRALLLLALLPALALAQTPQRCICVNGCSVASDPVPGGLPDSPTACNIYKPGTATPIASAPTVLSSTIPLSNASTCFPASVNYVPGPAGSVAGLVPIPAQPAGTLVTFTGTFIEPAGETAQSAPLTFQSVAALPVLSGPPTGLRAR